MSFYAKVQHVDHISHIAQRYKYWSLQNQACSIGCLSIRALKCIRNCFSLIVIVIVCLIILVDGIINNDYVFCNMSQYFSLQQYSQTTIRTCTYIYKHCSQTTLRTCTCPTPCPAPCPVPCPAPWPTYESVHRCLSLIKDQI